MVFQRLSPCLTKFARSTAANAAVEYAVCIGSIVGVVLLAGSVLGTRLQNTFSNAATVAQSPGNRSSEHGDNVAISAAATGSNEAAPISGRALVLWLVIVLVVGGVPPLATLWLVRKRAARRAASIGPDPDTVPKRLQAKFVAKRQAILQFLSADTQQLAHGQMAVRNVMSTTPMTKSPDDDVHELRKLMKENVIRHLLVCSPTGALVGIVSDRDINGKEGHHVRDIMTPSPITVRSDTPVGTVTTMMLARQISCVPVVDDGRLLGIVTTSDLLMALQCVLRLIEQLSLPLEHDDEKRGPAGSPIGGETEADADLISAEETREYEHCDAGE